MMSLNKPEKILLDFDEKKFFVEGQACGNFFSKARGLMFRNGESSPILVFDFNEEVREPIHSFFVFFPFVAVWLDTSGKVLELKEVRPFSFYVHPRSRFKTLVEIPVNSKNRKILDDIEKFK